MIFDFSIQRITSSSFICETLVYVLEASVVMIKDLNLIESKLRYLKKLAENNSATIVENQARIQKSLIDGIAKQSMDKNFNLSLVNLKFNGKSVFSSDDIEKINAIKLSEIILFILLPYLFFTSILNI
jgi:signal transduction histidine kinase